MKKLNLRPNSFLIFNGNLPPKWKFPFLSSVPYSPISSSQPCGTLPFLSPALLLIYLPRSWFNSLKSSRKQTNKQNHSSFLDLFAIFWDRELYQLTEKSNGFQQEKPCTCPFFVRKLFHQLPPSEISPSETTVTDFTAETSERMRQIFVCGFILTAAPSDTWATKRCWFCLLTSMIRKSLSAKAPLRACWGWQWERWCSETLGEMQYCSKEVPGLWESAAGSREYEDGGGNTQRQRLKRGLNRENTQEWQGQTH